MSSTSAHPGASAPADILLGAHLNAFYREDGEKADFTENTHGGVSSFWMWAEMMEMLVDADERVPGGRYLAAFDKLFRGFIERWGSAWDARNNFNDDILWMVIACTRAHLRSPKPEYLEAAKTNFELCYRRAYDSDLGGGLWQHIERQTKNACVNGPGAIAASLLAKATGDSDYTKIAGDLFQWLRATLWDSSTGRVADHIRKGGVIDATAFTYNQGTFVGAADLLGETSAAKVAAIYARDAMTWRGMMPAATEFKQSGEPDDSGGFNGIAARWISRYMRGCKDQAAFEPWLRQNADAAWAARRTDGLAWSRWPECTPQGRRSAWACSSAVVLWQVL